ncbi:MAG: SPFH domain-containing protein [Bacillota bacterium]|nr:SPFH domain-containing protein [Bacillota bacterium]
MGLIKAALGSVSSVMADQWKEYFTIDALDVTTLVKRGYSQKGGSNTKGSQGVITKGSVIAVPEGCAMLITDQGGICEFTAESGEFVYDSSTEPTCLYGGFGKGLAESFKKFQSRFAMGGLPGRDQRVYYINLKELIDNKFGTPQPISYRDPRYLTCYIRMFGTYSYKISDPMVFFQHISGNVEDEYDREELDTQLSSEFINALTVAMVQCSKELSFDELPTRQLEVSKYMNDALDEDWGKLRGLEIVNVAIVSVSPDEDTKMRVDEYNRAKMFGTQEYGVGRMLDAQATALEAAGANEGGAMGGILGVGMMGNLMNNMGGGQNMMDRLNQPVAAPTARTAPSGDNWKCSCGKENTGNFCAECGGKKPEPIDDNKWICECGAKNLGRFCTDCGKPKPADVVCKKCGYKPDKNRIPKFCPECGEKF